MSKQNGGQIRNRKWAAYKATTTATAAKTSLKKGSRTTSKFIALILSRLIRQMLETFFGVEF